MMTKSQSLLLDYQQNGSEAAFRELVSQYIDLVYSTALRSVTGNSQLAQEVTQTVFIHLSRRASTLPSDVMLGGWLHQDTCYTAATLLRSERRRAARERQAVEMNTLNSNSEENWAEVAPVLDEAIGQLSPEDRNAILLRFFEQHDFRAVGEALGASEDAARMRVTRALEKLHLILKRRGIAYSAAALGASLSVEAVAEAPAGMAAQVVGAVLAGAVASGGTSLTLVKLMTLTKLKIGILTALILIGAAIPLGRHYQAQTKLHHQENRLFMQQKAARSAHWLLALRNYAGANNEQLPKSLDAAIPYLDNLSEDNRAELLKTTNQYEVSYPYQYIASTNEEIVIVLREKEPWRTLDGRLAKVYGYADGSSQIHFENDGSFSEWENKYLPKKAKP